MNLFAVSQKRHSNSNNCLVQTHFDSQTFQGSVPFFANDALLMSPTSSNELLKNWGKTNFYKITHCNSHLHFSILQMKSLHFYKTVIFTDFQPHLK